MYGYITPDKPYMCFKDYALYRAFYCGTCLFVGKKYGQLPRFTTNYDMTFLEIVIYSFLNRRPAFAKRACVLNPFKKKQTVVADPLLDDLSAFNLLLSYNNLTDDIVDSEKGGAKRLRRRLLRRAYRKAKRRLPACDEIIASRYKALLELERTRCESIDRAAAPFGCMMAEGVHAVVEAYKRSEPPTLTGDADEGSHSALSENIHVFDFEEKEWPATVQNAGAHSPNRSIDTLEKFCYHLGKYIYLIDALDDLAKDYQKGAYNPFLAAFGDFADRASFLETHGDAIRGSINITINQIIAEYNALALVEARNLLDNIVYRGLSRKAELVFNGARNASREKI